MTPTAALIGALTAVAFVLRLPNQGSSLFADELATYYNVAGHSLTGMLHILSTHTWDLNPPLFQIFAWIGWNLAGGTVQSLRWISLVAGATLVPLTYLLGRQTVGRRAATIGAALIAFSPFMIYFSSEARAFELQTSLCVASTLSLLAALRTRRIGWWAAYAGFTCAAVYTQYLSIFVLAAQFGWALWARPESRRALLVATAAAAICFAPWVPAFLYQSRSSLIEGIGLFEHFGLHAIRYDLGRLLLGGPFFAVSGLPGTVSLILSAVGATVLLVGLLARVAGKSRIDTTDREPTEIPLLIVLALAAPVGCGLYSSITSDIWEPKDLITSLPAIALLFGFVASRAAQPAMTVGLGLVLAGFLVGSWQVLRPVWQRPDYDAAARYVQRVGGPTAPIAEAPFLTPGPLIATEVAVRLVSSARARQNPVLRVAVPPLGLVLRSKPGAVLPASPSQAVARRAAQLAAGGKLFLVVAGVIPEKSIAELRRLGPGSPSDTSLLGFIRDIPARFKLTGRRTFPGFFLVSVYTFSDAAPQRHRLR